MKRRLAALTLCFAMAASMLAGCGEKEEDDNKELVLYTWEGLFPRVLDGFRKDRDQDHALTLIQMRPCWKRLNRQTEKTWHCCG
ncbi:MAG: hypothetical protein ACLRMZ_22420 [Blautia marasmi]